MRALAMCVLLLALPTGYGAGAQPLEKLTIAYASTAPGSDSTFLFAGQQLGFFKEQGLDVDIQSSGGAVAAAGFIASGTADLGFGSVEAVPGYVLKGVPMKAIYTYSYRPIFKLAFIKGAKVQDIKGLKGARVGLQSLASASAIILQYELKEAGMSMNDVSLVPLGGGASAAPAVKSGQVDALMYHDTFYPILAAAGIDVTFYSSPALERGFAGQGIYGLEKTLHDRRHAVEAFLRGLTKSLAYAKKDPEGATRAFGQLVPEIAKNPELEKNAWLERAKITYPIDGQWGKMDDTIWENLLDVLMLGGTIKEKPPLAKLYTTDFLQVANAVDLSKLP